LGEGSSKPRFAKRANLWVQSLAFIFAGVWGVFVFWDQQIAKPAEAVHLTTELRVRQVGTRASPTGDGSALAAIELDFNATNPSARTVYILNNYWLAIGTRIQPQDNSRNWAATAETEIEQRKPISGGAHYRATDGHVVAWGSLVPDDALRPNESVSRSYIFYVPEGAYDMIDVQTALPSAAQGNVVHISWRLDGLVVSPTATVTEAGRARPATAAELQGDPPLNLQQAGGRQQLSLWSVSPGEANH
jgi:hypothetical protein